MILKVLNDNGLINNYEIKKNYFLMKNIKIKSLILPLLKKKLMP